MSFFQCCFIKLLSFLLCLSFNSLIFYFDFILRAVGCQVNPGNQGFSSTLFFFNFFVSSFNIRLLGLEFCKYFFLFPFYLLYRSYISGCVLVKLTRIDLDYHHLDIIFYIRKNLTQPMTYHRSPSYYFSLFLFFSFHS